MSVELLTEHHLEFLSLKGGCTGSSEFTLVKLPHCWKSHVTAHIFGSIVDPNAFCLYGSYAHVFDRGILKRIRESQVHVYMYTYKT